MKKIKNILAILLCLAMLFSMTACAGKEETVSTGDEFEYITSEYYVDEVIEGSETVEDNTQTSNGENSQTSSVNSNNNTNSQTSNVNSNNNANSQTSNVNSNNNTNSQTSSVNSNNNTNSQTSNVNPTNKNPNRVQPSGSKDTIDESKFYGKHLKLMLKFDPNSDEEIVKGYMDGLKSWMKKYNCTYEFVASGQYNKELTASIAAKDAPDLFYQIESFPEVVSLGLVQPIEDYIPANQKYLSQQSINEGTWAGHVYALYVSEGVGRTYLKYNPDLFLERGVKSPREYFEEDNWTWNTFREVAKAMTGNGVYGVSPNQFAMFGGKDIVKVSENGDITSTLNSSWNTEFLQWVYKLYAEDKVFATDSNAKFAMAVTQLDAEPKYDSKGNPTSFMKKDGANWEIVPFPKKPGDSSYVSHSQQFSFTVPVGAKNPAMSTSLALSMCAGWQAYVDRYKSEYSAYEKKVRDACKNATTFLYYPDVHTFLPSGFTTWDNDQFCDLLTKPTATAMATILPIHQKECSEYNSKY